MKLLSVLPIQDAGFPQKSFYFERLPYFINQYMFKSMDFVSFCKYQYYLRAEVNELKENFTLLFTSALSDSKSSTV